MSELATASSQGMESFAALFEESLKRSDMRAGEVVSFGGGFFRRGDKQIFMDPCLAFRE